MDALVEFRVDQQEDSKSLYDMLKVFNDDLQQEKAENMEVLAALRLQREQDIQQHCELIEEFRRLLDESHKVSNDYKLALDAVSTLEFVLNDC